MRLTYREQKPKADGPLHIVIVKCVFGLGRGRCALPGVCTWVHSTAAMVRLFVGGIVHETNTYATEIFGLTKLSDFSVLHPCVHHLSSLPKWYSMGWALTSSRCRA